MTNIKINLTTLTKVMPTKVSLNISIATFSQTTATINLIISIISLTLAIISLLTTNISLLTAIISLFTVKISLPIRILLIIRINSVILNLRTRVMKQIIARILIMTSISMLILANIMNCLKSFNLIMVVLNITSFKFQIKLRKIPNIPTIKPTIVPTVRSTTTTIHKAM